MTNSSKNILEIFTDNQELVDPLHWKNLSGYKLKHYWESEKKFKLSAAMLRSYNFLYPEFPLDEKSKVFEPGCNFSTNLRYFHDQTKCQVYGIDVNKPSIKKIKKHFEGHGFSGNFIVEDARNLNLIEKYGEDYFDLIITRGYLMHCPAGERTHNHIQELIKISKRMIIVENTKIWDGLTPTSPGIQDLKLYEQVDGKGVSPHRGIEAFPAFQKAANPKKNPGNYVCMHYDFCAIDDRIKEGRPVFKRLGTYNEKSVVYDRTGLKIWYTEK